MNLDLAGREVGNDYAAEYGDEYGVDFYKGMSRQNLRVNGVGFERGDNEDEIINGDGNDPKKNYDPETETPPRKDKTPDPETEGPPSEEKTPAPEMEAPPSLEKTAAPETEAPPRKEETPTPEIEIDWFDNQFEDVN